MAADSSSIIWRTLVPADAPEFSLLLDRAFGLSSPASYLADFPVWHPAISPMDSRFQIGGFREGRLLSTASIRFVDYRFEGGNAERFGLIGGVATHPDFSGRGYGGEAMDRVLAEGEKRGITSFALWGAESSVYSTRGFKFAGRQVRLPLAALVIPKTIITGYEIRSGWEFAIEDQFLSRKSGVLYSGADVRWLSQHGNVEWRSFWRDGKCLAYCGWNRGIDLPNMIHELGGDPGAVVQLLYFLRERYPKLEWLAHPDSATTLGISTTGDFSEEYLAQFRVSDSNLSRLGSMWMSGMDAC